jgi:hypothetical protein
MDDIGFLIPNSVADSTIMVADSGRRDREKYPLPSEYVVTIEPCVPMVTGIEILDGALPGSMYAVDFHNDRLDVTTVRGGPADPTGAGVAAELDDLGSSAVFVSVFEADVACDIVVLTAAQWEEGCAAAAAAALPPLGIGSTVPSKVAAVRRVVGGVDLQVIAPGAPAPAGTVAFTYVRTTYAAPLDGPVAALVARYGTVGVNALAQAPGTYDVVAYDLYGAAVPDGAPFLYRLRHYPMRIENGNYVATELAQQLASQLRALSLGAGDSNLGFDVLSTSSASVDRQNRLLFVSATTPFLLNMRSSTSNEVLGFDTLASARDGGYAPALFGSNRQLFLSVSAGGTSESPGTTHRLTAPGVVNLMGPRYITLRCPEIEQYLYTGMTCSENATGIGLFKLVSGNQVSNLRFDFVSVVRKPFHPIGRLTRLTLRFELSNGVLYDFKGVNHHLTFSINFRSPAGRVVFSRSVLNPDYDPDLVKYQLRTSAARDPIADGPDDDDNDVDEGDVAAAAAAARLRTAERTKAVLLQQHKYDF